MIILFRIELRSNLLLNQRQEPQEPFFAVKRHNNPSFISSSFSSKDDLTSYSPDKFFKNSIKRDTSLFTAFKEGKYCHYNLECKLETSAIDNFDHNSSDYQDPSGRDVKESEAKDHDCISNETELLTSNHPSFVFFLVITGLKFMLWMDKIIGLKLTGEGPIEFIEI